ncbi:hypothetical protein AAY473_037086 [Plecturocebus cupreus]
MGFHHVDQAGFKLLTSGDLSSSVSQSARITGMSCHTRPTYVIFTEKHTVKSKLTKKTWSISIWEAEAGGSPEIRNSRPAWPTLMLERQTGERQEESEGQQKQAETHKHNPELTKPAETGVGSCCL